MKSKVLKVEKDKPLFRKGDLLIGKGSGAVYLATTNEDCGSVLVCTLYIPQNSGLSLHEPASTFSARAADLKMFEDKIELSN